MERHKIIDTLRGFSLFGLLLVHLPLMGNSSFLFLDLESAKEIGDKISFLLYFIFFEAKLFPIFAFLFGYGFALQLQGKAGVDTSLFLKRLLGLAILGILHNVLFFNGDILFSYACLGFILYLLRNNSNKSLILISLISLLFSSVTFYIIGSTPLTEGDMNDLIVEFKTSNQMNFIDSVLSRVQSGIAIFPFIFLNNWPTSFAMLGFGFVCGKINALTDPYIFNKIPSHLPIISFFIGLFGGICNTFHELLFLSKGMGMAIFAIASPFMSFVYIYIMIYMFKSNMIPGSLDLLSRNGKMSLSIYLCESILMGILFQAWGFGLFDKLRIHELLLISFPCYIFLSYFSYLWFNKYEIGPMEWILRKFVKLLSKEKSI